MRSTSSPPAAGVFRLMTQEEHTLAQLGVALSHLARPHDCDETLSPRVQATLQQLGLSCDERTPREALIAELWARKRSLSMAFLPGATQHDWPPTAA